MSSLRVAGVQMDIEWEAPEVNFRTAGAAIDRAAGNGADLVVLPEMFATGFSMEATQMAAHAERTRAWIAETAARAGVWLIAGLAVSGEKGEKPRNAALLCDPTGGFVLEYHKVHPFSLAREHEHFDAGDRVETVSIAGVPVTLVVCYDLRFPELFRARAADTTLFIVIANWPAPRRHHWQALLTARAIENQAYVLGVNRVGQGGSLTYLGDSMLVSPLGLSLSTVAGQAGTVDGVVDSETVKTVRKRYSFLADRRSDLYAKL